MNDKTTDKMIKEMREQMKPDESTLRNLQTRLTDEKAGINKPPHTKGNSLWLKLGAPLAACLLVAALFLSSNHIGLQKNNGTKDSENIALANPSSYDELFSTIESFYTAQESFLDGGSAPPDFEPSVRSPQSARNSLSGAPTLDLAAPNASDVTPSDGGTTSKSAPDYAGTNVQVAGIDEGDMIKTDGNHIYVLSSQSIVILSAEGAQSKELSRINLSEQSGHTGYGYPTEIFIADNILVVLSNHHGQDLLRGISPSSPVPDTSTKTPPDEVMSDTAATPTMDTMPAVFLATATLYDVSNPMNPTLLTQISQSGSYRSARLQNGVLYLVSNYYVHHYDICRDTPETFVPLCVVDQTTRLMPPEDIHIFPALQSPGYAVISAINLADPAVISQKTVLGGGDVLYMSHNNLYLAASQTVTEESAPYQDSVYTITDLTTTTKTHLAKLSLNQGILTFAANATINGNLLNQFSLDEYEGNLRLALTTTTSQSRKLVDKSHDVISYQYVGGPPQSNGIYVLSPSLTVLGSIEGLAQDERIYSVRFSGQAGYMVTFRQVDPLFSLDLSDPSHPKVLGALKIPGFSTYLHPYAPGLLFGLGFDSDGIRSGKLKLSMFDISDPFNVKELSTLLLDSTYAEAAYNHRAIIVDATRDLIGFKLINPNGASSTYAIYGYSAERGFYQRANLEYGGSTPYNTSARGFYVDDTFYVGSATSLDVFTLAAFEKLLALDL
ncbi:MAG: beta-propeller domain-containing protein [Gracilibacteraceae bacterium]|jgi:uncharacterized secreted protein with C-terminal beta-propeller domain|nr:beta-propeller domain-containing protein [Gracilibacteraceae bacterium]